MIKPENEISRLLVLANRICWRLS